jgi:hypothetical protein
MDPIVRTAVERRIDELTRRAAYTRRLRDALTNITAEDERDIAALTKALPKPTNRKESRK